MISEVIIDNSTLIKRAIKPIFLLLIIGLLSIAVMAYAKKFNVFKLQRISVEGNVIVSSDMIVNKSGMNFGDDILKIDLSSAADEIEMNPFIRCARISRYFPNKLSIQVIERKPIAFVSLSELYCIDGEGTLLPSSSDKKFDLPVITGLEDVAEKSIGDKLNVDGTDAIIGILRNLEEGFPPIYNNISEVNISPYGEIKLIGVKNGTVIHLGRKEHALKLDRLRSLLLTVRPSEGLSYYNYIDLRFENQVIVKERLF